MKMEPISEQPAKLGKTMDQVLPWIWLAFGAGLIVFSIWGVSVCSATARYYVSPRATGMRTFVLVASWCVLFLPFAYMGFRIMRSTLRQMRRTAVLRRQETKPAIEILPPATVRALTRDGIARSEVGTATQADHRQQGRVDGVIAQSADKANLYPLDEATKRRLDKLGARAAKITGITVGVLFLVAGLSGFVLAWIYTYRPYNRQFFFYSGLASFRLTVYFLVGCGLAVVVGGIILRSTFKRPETAWLAPLQAFTAVVSRRIAAKEQARPKKDGES